MNLVGMEWGWKDTLHGHFWTILNGLLATLFGLDWCMLITIMDSKDTVKDQLCGSKYFFTNENKRIWCFFFFLNPCLLLWAIVRTMQTLMISDNLCNFHWSVPEFGQFILYKFSKFYLTSWFLDELELKSIPNNS